MDSHVKMLEKKKTGKAKELKDKNEDLSTTTALIDDLKSSVRNQELSVEAARGLQINLKGLCEGLDRIKSSNQNQRDLVSQFDLDLQALWIEIEDYVSKYNGCLQELVPLLPISGSVPARITCFEDKISVNSQEVGASSVKKVKSVLALLKEEVSDALLSSKNDYQEKLDELGKCEDRFSSASESLKILCDKITTKGQALEEERDLNKAKCSVRLREAESFETKVSSLRDPILLEEKIAHYERQCAELEMLKLKDQETSSSLFRATLGEIEQACAAMDRFETFFFSKLQESDGYRSSFLSLYEKISIVSST